MYFSIELHTEDSPASSLLHEIFILGPRVKELPALGHHWKTEEGRLCDGAYRLSWEITHAPSARSSLA